MVWDVLSILVLVADDALVGRPPTVGGVVGGDVGGGVGGGNGSASHPPFPPLPPAILPFLL